MLCAERGNLWEPRLRGPHAKAKKSPFSWPGELLELTCGAASS